MKSFWILHALRSPIPLVSFKFVVVNTQGETHTIASQPNEISSLEIVYAVYKQFSRIGTNPPFTHLTIIGCMHVLIHRIIKYSTRLRPDNRHLRTPSSSFSSGRRMVFISSQLFATAFTA